MSHGQPRFLTAEYSGPAGSNTTSFTSHALPSLATAGESDSSDETAAIDAKTTYLAALRAGVTEVQDAVNEFLTQKMEEDKMEAEKSGAEAARDQVSRAGKGGVKSKKQEDLEEEMYGEEDPEAD